MNVAKIIEVVGSSDKSFDQAIRNGIKEASKTLRGIRGAKILSKNVKIENDKIVEYRVNMKIAFGVKRKK